MRQLERIVSGLASVPAPAVHDQLSNLKWLAGYRAQEVLEHIAAGLERSLKTHEVIDSAGDPYVNVKTAAQHLHRAARHAGAIAEELEAAQAAIAGQGFKLDVEPRHGQ